MMRRLVAITVPLSDAPAPETRVRDIPLGRLSLQFNFRQCGLKSVYKDELTDSIIIVLFHPELSEVERGRAVPQLSLEQAREEHPYLFADPDIFGVRYLDV